MIDEVDGVARGVNPCPLQLVSSVRSCREHVRSRDGGPECHSRGLNPMVCERTANPVQVTCPLRPDGCIEIAEEDAHIPRLVHIQDVPQLVVGGTPCDRRVARVWCVVDDEQDGRLPKIEVNRSGALADWAKFGIKTREGGYFR